MPKSDVLDQSATRVELDQRSRDARLRLECVERLLAVRDLPRQSLLRRFLRCFGSRTRIGEQIAGRSMIAVGFAGRAGRERVMRVEDVRRVLVIGAGTMGVQIGLQVAGHGYHVVLHDADPAATVRVAHEGLLLVGHGRGLFLQRPGQLVGAHDDLLRSARLVPTSVELRSAHASSSRTATSLAEPE